MKKLWILAMTAAALGASSVASAQFGQAPNNDQGYFTLRAGAFIPLDSNLRDVTNWLAAAGFDYTFPYHFGNNGEAFLSVDWLGKTTSGGRFNAFPICINGRFYLNSTGRTVNNATNGQATQSYVFLGLGAFYFDMSPTTWRFGGRGGFGVDLNNNWLVEVAAYVSSGTSGTNIHASAIGAYVGYKF